MHKLMHGLGFGAGYCLQGGDIGSYAARIMATLYDSCKGEDFNRFSLLLSKATDSLRVALHRK